MKYDLSRAHDGVLLVDKPAGWTSFDVCAKIRGQIRAEYRLRHQTPTKRQLRVGHAGTLDPFATGLLIVLLGDATKRADSLLKQDKIYETTIRLGQTSTTGDPEGEITEVSTRIPTQQEVAAAAARFVGHILQTPPAYSALKVHGQRAYALARKGVDVALEPRPVTIHSIDVCEYEYPLVRLRMSVGSGTYIRSVAADIGETLGVGAYCRELRRIQVGEYSVTDAVTAREE